MLLVWLVVIGMKCLFNAVYLAVASLSLAGCAELMAVNTIASIARLSAESAAISAAPRTPTKLWTGEVCVFSEGINETASQADCNRVAGVMKSLGPALSVGCVLNYRTLLSSVSFCQLSDGRYNNNTNSACRLPNGNVAKSSILKCLKDEGVAIELLEEPKLVQS